MKEMVAKAISKRIKDGEVIGVGTGSTVQVAIEEITRRVKKEGLKLSCVPTSFQTAWACKNAGLEVLSPLYDGEISWGFDGADEVDDKFRLIKGKGGALLLEKILTVRCKEFVVVVDESKLVKDLGAKTAVPVEAVPEALFYVRSELVKLGGDPQIRQAVAKHGPVITEKGNILLVTKFRKIEDSLEADIKKIVGVVESGLFVGYTDEVIIAKKDGVYSQKLDKAGKIKEEKVG